MEDFANTGNGTPAPTNAPPHFLALVKPSRSPINRSGMSFRGKGFSQKNKRFVKYESLLEMKIARLFEFARAAIAFSEQPPPLQIVVGGKNRRYTPDLIVSWDSGAKWLVEVKPWEMANTEEMVIKAGAIRRAAVAQGYHFVMLTERCLDKPAMLSIELLLSIRRRHAQRDLGNHPSDEMDLPELPVALEEVFALTHSVTYREARELVGAKSVLDLLAYRVITWDLSDGLSDSTRLFQFEDGDDSCLFA